MASEDFEFVPNPLNPGTRDGWPVHLISGGFIRIELQDVEGDIAHYSDQFGDEYEIEDSEAGSWWIEVRED